MREDRQYYWRYDAGRGWHSGYSEAEETVHAGAIELKNRAKLTVPVNWGTYRLEVTDPETKLVLRYRFYAGWNAQDAESVGNRPDRVRFKLKARQPNRVAMKVRSCRRTMARRWFWLKPIKSCGANAFRSAPMAPRSPCRLIELESLRHVYLDRGVPPR